MSHLLGQMNRPRGGGATLERLVGPPGSRGLGHHWRLAVGSQSGSIATASGHPPKQDALGLKGEENVRIPGNKERFLAASGGCNISKAILG